MCDTWQAGASWRLDCLSDCITQLGRHGIQMETEDGQAIQLEASVELTGTIKTLPEGKSAPGGHELAVDWWRIVGGAPGGLDAISSRIAAVRSTDAPSKVSLIFASTGHATARPSRPSSPSTLR